jgi:hypothetical protein
MKALKIGQSVNAPSKRYINVRRSSGTQFRIYAVNGIKNRAASGSSGVSMAPISMYRVRSATVSYGCRRPHFGPRSYRQIFGVQDVRLIPNVWEGSVVHALSTPFVSR